ncbi:XdhC family protein [Limimaricola pyoseonensis]|uniref:Xanthine dehydrogenase accessory factor n=1 Tax=Limimaricola pyoseonensis TaxID=521013 RepID=A0A1G7FP01_9RHOB|nr:XdhC family protein [Limimaricola pyoseonensis]SDE77661.1 xanthine dehydrogenase accessory factor [Limimaricola pyoseonensis]
MSGQSFIAKPVTQVLAPLSAAEAAPALAALAPRGGVLAMLTGIDGSFYRPLGAVMSFPDGAAPVGQLSSGCIEGDLALQAAAVRRSGRPRTLRYGKGSEFIDIRLPCGSGIDVMLQPVDPGPALDAPLADLEARRQTRLRLDGLPVLPLHPDPRMLVAGEGPEAATFVDLARTAGFPAERVDRIDPAAIDRFTAVVLFFHDHDREPDLLSAALESPAFWIGAQGSRRAQARRRAALAAAGFGAVALDRLRGPIGLIPGTRDPRALAVSVLAEIVEAAGCIPDDPRPFLRPDGP